MKGGAGLKGPGKTKVDKSPYGKEFIQRKIDAASAGLGNVKVLVFYKEKLSTGPSDITSSGIEMKSLSEVQPQMFKGKGDGVGSNGSKGKGNRMGNFAGKINADNIPNMTKNDILEGLPSNWKYTENNGFVHIRDANGNIRMRIDPSDKVTKYDHVHIFDESGNPLDKNLNIVDRKSPDAHIPYKK